MPKSAETRMKNHQRWRLMLPDGAASNDAIVGTVVIYFWEIDGIDMDGFNFSMLMGLYQRLSKSATAKFVFGVESEKTYICQHRRLPCCVLKTCSCLCDLDALKNTKNEFVVPFNKARKTMHNCVKTFFVHLTHQQLYQTLQDITKLQ